MNGMKETLQKMKNKLIVFHKGLEIKLLPKSAKISPNINLPLRLVET